MRKHAWVIAERIVDGEDESETVYDLNHGNSRIASGLHTIASARVIIVGQRQDGERVWLEEVKDGYRTELTKSFPARSSAQSGIHQITFDPERPARSRYLARYGRSKRPGKWV